jgi:phospholipid/cholesterol/gamma-HCH transport system permease protein
MAGKMGSFITSSIGTMRVTEQIDALEVMGVNSLNYLVFPKIIALLFYPFVIGIEYVFRDFWRLDGWVYGGFTSSPEFIKASNRIYSVSYCVCIYKNIVLLPYYWQLFLHFMVII